MKQLFTILSAIATLTATSQIVTSVNSLPEVNDELEYQTLSVITDDYLDSGEGILWNFSGMYGDDQVTDVYAPASSGIDFPSFPDTDMIVDFAGVQAYANRNTTNIEVIGIAAGTFIDGLDEIEAQELSSPFVIRRAPVGYGDTFSGETSFNFSMAIDPDGTLGLFINGINPFPDSTVDSLRAVVTITRTEEVDSYGTAVFQNDAVPALRLVQQDQIIIGIELFLNTELIDSWIDISDFIDPELLGFGNTTTTNYIFLGEESKEHLLEITIDSNTNEPTGRYSSDYYVGVEDLSGIAISVFPNPTVDQLTLTGERLTAVELYDLTGKLCYSESYTPSSRIEIDLSELATGVYMLKATNSQGTVLSKPVIKE